MDGRNKISVIKDHDKSQMLFWDGIFKGSLLVENPSITPVNLLAPWVHRSNPRNIKWPGSMGSIGQIEQLV